MSNTSSVAKKILIIDDDVDTSIMMKKALSGKGYRILQATNGPSGLDVFKEEQPDLVLLDVALPGMSGFEVAADIRNNEAANKRTIIVIITAYSQSFLVSSEFQSGIDSYLTKPVVLNDLMAQVTQLLEI